MRTGPVSFATRLTAAVALSAIAAVGVSAGAQAVRAPDVTIRATRSDTMHVEAGAAMTAVFAVRNASSDSATFSGRLDLPKGWRTVTGPARITLAPHASDTWLAGISVPSSAAAGTYVIHGVATMNAAGAADSIVVQVEPQRGLDVVALDAPGWVMAGDAYEARFVVRNTGNVPVSVALEASAGRAGRAIADPASLNLPAAGSAVVAVRTALTPNAHRTADDVLQLVAVDRADATNKARASALTTIVPRVAGDGDYTTMPAAFAVRTTGASGVSPFIAGGSGPLADGRTRVDFFLQAPTDQRSPWGFGERDEYRVSVARDGYTLRLGDNVYGNSILTSSGVMGTGAEVVRKRGALETGAFAQNYRWTPGAPTEEGAYATITRDSATRATVNTLLRESAGATVAVGGVSGGMRVPLGGRVELEGAASDSAGAAGSSWRARYAGDTLGVRYDASVLRGSDAFAGPARGTFAVNAALGARVTRDLDVSANVSRHDWSTVVASIGHMGQAYSTATLAATWHGVNSLEYGWLARRDDGALSPVNGAQHGIRASTAGQFGRFGISGSVEHGIARQDADAPTTDYSLVSMALRVGLGSIGSIGVSGSRGAGHSLTGSNGDLLAAGANAQLRLPLNFEVGMTMSAQRATFGVLDTSGAWFSVTDAHVDRRLSNGATIGLHARLLQNPSFLGAGNESAVYLEYRAPFHLPVGPSHETGRAVGQVMDADKSKPVAGVLVRIGDQAAVSDRDGYVRFAGLDERLYRVSVDPSGVTAGAILVGDVDLDLRDARASRTAFAVAVTRGALVAAHVGRDDDAVTEQPSGPSPVPARRMSPLGGVLVALQGARDTIYQVSDSRGNVAFGTIAPGRWTMTVQPLRDAQWMQYEHERVEFTVVAGERKDVEFVQVPVQREVKMIPGAGMSLRAKPLPEKKDKQER